MWWLIAIVFVISILVNICQVSPNKQAAKSRRRAYLHYRSERSYWDRLEQGRDPEIVKLEREERKRNKTGAYSNWYKGWYDKSDWWNKGR